MARVTVSDVLDAARARLNDTDPPGGSYADNSSLLGNPAGTGPFGNAYRRLYNAIAQVGSQRIQRDFYYTLPAYTNVIDPNSIGLTDMAEPEAIRERGNLSSVSIASTSDATPIVVTTNTDHGRSTNEEVVVSGVNGTEAPRGRFFVTVLGPTTLSLNGSVTDGNAGTGGTLSWSGERFGNPIEARDEEGDEALTDRIPYCVWESNVLKFRGATTDRQLWISYWASGNPPTSTSATIGLDDCVTLLGCLTAYYLAQAKNWPQMADGFLVEAFGPKREADGSGGLLREYLNTQVRSMQRTMRKRQLFQNPRGPLSPIGIQ